MTTTAATSASPYAAAQEAVRSADPAPRLELLGYNIETHRAVRRKFGLSNDNAAIRRVAQVFRTPTWVTGTVGLVDAMFLYDLARCVNPERIIEIGAASGCSTAVLLAAMADNERPLVDAKGVECVHSFDISRLCYFDKSRPVCAAVDEMVPVLRPGLRVHTRATAADAAAMFADDPVSLAFIDADHRHPWPTADLLMLAPALRPGAWVALHDIDLPNVARIYAQTTGEAVDWGDASGALHLFEGWPFEKIRGEGGGHNIGAVRMPDDRRITPDTLRKIIDRPWEATPSDTALGALGRG